jgi:hypothetical protein
MAVVLGLDFERIVEEKLKHISKKYPPHLVKNTGGKDPGTDENYWKIKREYRKKGL